MQASAEQEDIKEGTEFLRVLKSALSFIKEGGGAHEQNVEVIIKHGKSMQTELAFFVDTSPLIVAELKPTQSSTQGFPVKSGIK